MFQLRIFLMMVVLILFFAYMLQLLYLILLCIFAEVEEIWNSVQNKLKARLNDFNGQ